MKLLFLIPFAVGAAIQFVKVLIDFTVEKKFRRGSLRGSGGFPSVHSGISASITTLVAFYAGLHSIEFAIALTFSFLFWYDAANLRFEAGQHASSLNQINKDLNKLHPEYEKEQKNALLKERLGHTVGEVVGGVFAGILITLLLVTILQ